MATTLYVDGKKVVLEDKDYLSAGGQARIYQRSGTVYKVFDQAPSPHFEKKLQALQILGTRKSIVAPQKLLRLKGGALAGYTMDFVPSTLPMPKLFPPGFQTKNHVTMADVTSLVTQMIETISFIHDRGFLMVDGNEFNYLVTEDFRRVYFIDVDSYQIPGFPATVIMPTIRDWLSADFHTGSDWFSFAVIATQLFMGIHPFRGTWRVHPEVRDLRDRTLRKVSVFDPEVALPTAARSPDNIPKTFREWLVRVFQEGERTPPPLPGAAPLFAVKAHTAPSHIRKEETPCWPAGLAAESRQNGRTGMVVEGRTYAIQDGFLIELRSFETAAGRQMIERQRWPLSHHAYQVLDGLIAVDHLGARFLVIPFAEGRCSQFRTVLLDGHRIIDGRFHQRVVIVVSAKDDIRYRTTLHLAEDRETIILEQQVEADPTDVNFVVLKGTTLATLTDNALELSLVGQSGARVIEGGESLAGGILLTDGEHLYWRHEKLFRLSLGA